MKDKNELIEQVNRLKESKHAVIMAHYYAPDEVQEVADYIGDSYYLAKMANKITEQTIVFAGVRFMGESAKALNPDKKVLMPDLMADCAMAHMATKERIQLVREQYQDLAVVCYINSTAELKSYVDVCVTSANAVKVIAGLKEKNIYFIPDQNLARHVAEQLPDKNFIFNEGYCPIHNSITAADVGKAKSLHPDAKVMAHPECKKEVLELCDYIGSTSGIIDRIQVETGDEFLICTEMGVLYELQKQYPNKKFYMVKEDFVCGDMKLNSLDKIIACLETGCNEVILDEEMASLSCKPLEKMLELAK